MSHRRAPSNGTIATAKPLSDTLFPYTRASESHNRSSQQSSTMIATASKQDRTRSKATSKATTASCHAHRYQSRQQHTGSASLTNPLELPEIVAMVLAYLSPHAMLHARRVSRTWNRIAQELLFHRQAYTSSTRSPTAHIVPVPSLKLRHNQFLGAGNTVHITFADQPSGLSNNDPRFAEELAAQRALQRQHLEQTCLSQAKLARGNITGLAVRGNFDPMDLLMDSAMCCAAEEQASTTAALTAIGGARAGLSLVTVLHLDISKSSFALSELDLVALLTGFPRLRHLSVVLNSHIRVPNGGLRTSPALPRLAALSSTSNVHTQGMAIGMLSNNNTLQARGIQMSFQDMLFLLTLLPNLRTLELAECLMPPWNMLELVQQIHQYCPQLRRLHLQPTHGQFSLQDHLVIVQGLPALTELALDMPPPERIPRGLHPLAALNADRLTTLHLGAFEYDERTMAHLHGFLCESTQLRELYAKHLRFPIELLIEPLIAAKALEEKLNNNNGESLSTTTTPPKLFSKTELQHWACKNLVRLEMGFAKPKSTSLVQSEAQQISNVFRYIVQHLSNLAHLDANFSSLSLDKQGGVSQLKALCKLETVNLVSRTDVSLSRHQFDWLVANRSCCTESPQKKKSNRKASKLAMKMKQKLKKQQHQHEPATSVGESTVRGRSTIISPRSSTMKTTMIGASPIGLSSNEHLPSASSPSMSPWASPVHTGVFAMPRSRSPSPLAGAQRLSMTMSPILLPEPSIGLTKVKTNLSDETDLDGMETSGDSTSRWFKHLSTKVKKLLHISAAPAKPA
ncbi:hypothetical protein BGW42_004067, partial [Actinomortierella wolfii]